MVRRQRPAKNRVRRLRLSLKYATCETYLLQVYLSAALPQCPFVFRQGSGRLGMIRRGVPIECYHTDVDSSLRSKRYARKRKLSY
jgi:hypothetical protein